MGEPDTYYKKTNGPWYYIRDGIYNNLSYYFEFVVTNPQYNMTVNITLTSNDTQTSLATTETTNPFNVVVNDNGSRTFDSECLIVPAMNKTRCSYLMDSTQNVTYAWELNDYDIVEATE